MKIAFVTSIIYPSPTANRIHILSMATAFAKKGHIVTLLCQSVSDFDLLPSIKKNEIGTEKSISSAWRYASFLATEKHDFWFIREPHLMLLTILFFFLRNFRQPPFVLYEVHDMPRDFFDTVSLKLLTLCKEYKIITITNLLKEDLVKKYNLKPEYVMVLPDGVDAELFSGMQKVANPFSKEKNATKSLVVYTGSLFPWKGVYTLVDVAKRTPDVDFWIIGGYEKDIEMVKKAATGLDNVRVWGHVPHNKIINFLQLADVLVLPNSGTYLMSERYTSPLKLFEYMASQRPIVASRLPSIQEILRDGENAYLVEPDSVEALKEGIERVLLDEKRQYVVTNAKKDVANYTWDSRVERILQAVK